MTVGGEGRFSPSAMISLPVLMHVILHFSYLSSEAGAPDHLGPTY